MNIWCKIFGHNPYPYRRVTLAEVDGMGVQHANLTATCKRCDETYANGKIHVPVIKEQIR